MRLGIGLQRHAALRHGPPQAHGGQHIVQGLARTHVHTHTPRRDQWHASAVRELLQAVLLHGIHRTQQARHCQPDMRAKKALCARGYCVSSFYIDSRREIQQHLAVAKGRPQSLLLGPVPAKLVSPLGRAAPRHRDELAQLAPAQQVVRQDNGTKATANPPSPINAQTADRKSSTQQQLEPTASRRLVRLRRAPPAHPAARRHTGS